MNTKRAPARKSNLTDRIDDDTDDRDQTDDSSVSVDELAPESPTDVADGRGDTPRGTDASRTAELDRDDEVSEKSTERNVEDDEDEADDEAVDEAPPAKPKTARAKSRTARNANTGNGDAKNGGEALSASSMIMQLIGSVVTNNLSGALASVQDKVTEQVNEHGAEYLDAAKERMMEATEKVAEWGKKHPVQVVAAAVALVAVSAFLYATIRNKREAASDRE